jgi:hypothetical protein
VSVPREYARAIGRTDTTAAAPVLETVESLMLEERTRWAMTIHDGLTQSVTSAILELQVLRHRIETEPADAIASLHEIEDAIRHDLSEIRSAVPLDEGGFRRPDRSPFVTDSSSAGSCRRRITIEATSTPCRWCSRPHMRRGGGAHQCRQAPDPRTPS